MGSNISRGGAIGSAEANLSGLREAMQRLGVSFGEHVYYGIVVKRQGDSSHYEQTSGGDGGNDVYVEVDLMPLSVPVTCRLGAWASSGQGDGLWKIPKPGTEVLVCVPGGSLEAGPVIVGNLSSQNVPSDLDATTMVLKNSDGNIRIVAGGTTVVVTKDGNVDVTTPSGKTVNLNGTDYSGIKFDGAFESDLANVITDLLAGTVGGPTAQNLKSQSNLISMLSKLQAGTYRSTKVKLGG